MILSNIYGGAYYSGGNDNGTSFHNVPRFLEKLEPYADGMTQAKKIAMGEKYVNTAGLKDANLLGTNSNPAEVFDLSRFTPHEDYADNMFFKQFPMWERFEKHAMGTQKTRIYAFDFETLGIGDARKFVKGSTGAITEFGFAEMALNNGRLSEKSMVSVAFGINQMQMESYLDDLYRIRNGTVEAMRDYQARQSVLSTAERLSRYSGNITDIFDTKYVQEIKKSVKGKLIHDGNVTVIKALAPSEGKNLYSSMSGLLNEAVLGGMTEEQVRSALRNKSWLEGAELDKAVRDFAERKAQFEAAGLIVQNQDSSAMSLLKKKLVGVLGPGGNGNAGKANQFLFTFNGNNYDNILLNKIGDLSDHVNEYEIGDVYAALKYYMQGQDIIKYNDIALSKGGTVDVFKKMTQSGIARAVGVSFGENVAHHGGADSFVTANLAGARSFYNSGSLFFNILEMNKQRNKQGLWYKTFDLTDKQTLKDLVLFATSSTPYDKNGKDVLYVNGELASEYYRMGSNRNRMYSLKGIYNDPDGGVFAELNSLGSKKGRPPVQRFFKHADSVDELMEILGSNFIFDSKQNYNMSGKKNGLKTISEKQIKSYLADTARREYERLFSVTSISADGKGRTHGGFEELNKYYQAYEYSLMKPADLDIEDKDIADQLNAFQKRIAGNKMAKEPFVVANSSNYDDVLKSVLIKSGLGYDKDGTMVVSDRVLSNFKHYYGKLRDESVFLDELRAEFGRIAGENEAPLTNYRKTLIAANARNMLMDAAEKSAPEADASDLSLMRRQDLYSFRLSAPGKKAGDDAFEAVINFEDTQAARRLNNAVRAEARKRSGNEVNNMAHIYAGIVKDLRDRGIIQGGFTDKILNDIESVSVQNYQPYYYAEAVSSQIRDSYILPMQKSGWNFARALEEGDDKWKGIDKKLRNITEKKLEGYSGAYDIKAVSSGGTAVVDAFKTEADNIRAYIHGAVDSTQYIDTTIGGWNADAFKKYVAEYLGYDEHTTEEAARMLMYDNKRNFKGLNSIGWNADKNKAEWVTTFWHSGIKGDNGYILLSHADSSPDQLFRGLADADPEKARTVIKQLSEDGKVAAIPMYAVSRQELDIDPKYNPDIFERWVPEYKDGVMSYKKRRLSYNTITIGDGYQKIVRERLDAYKRGSGLKGLEIKLTDDAYAVTGWYASAQHEIEKMLTDESRSISERLNNVQGYANRTMNHRMSSMPALSGALESMQDEAGNYIRTAVPNNADIMKSSILDITQIQRLWLATAQDDLLSRNDTAMAEFIAQFGMPRRESFDFDSLKRYLNDELGRFDEDREHKLSGTLKQVFDKNLILLSPEESEGYRKTINSTILEYLHNAAEEGRYHDKTHAAVEYLWKNKDKISQLGNEHAADMNYIYMNSNLYNTQGAYMNGLMRPIFGQQQTAARYIASDVAKDLGDDVIQRYDLTLGIDGIQSGVYQFNKAAGKIAASNGMKRGSMEAGISMTMRQINTMEAMQELDRVGADIAGSVDRQSKFIYKSVAKALSEAKIDRTALIALSEKSTMEKLFSMSLDIIQKHQLANTYESRMAMNPEVANNRYFTYPYLKKAEFSEKLDRKHAEKLARIFDPEREPILLRDGDNLLDIYKRIEGEELFAAGERGIKSLHYTGVDGTISGSLKDIADYFVKGKGVVIDDIEAISGIKGIFNMEKGIVDTIEWYSGLGRGRKKVNSAVRELDEILEKSFGITNQDARMHIGLRYLGAVWTEAFGERAALIGSHALAKHMNTNAEPVHTQMVQIAQKFQNKGFVHNGQDAAVLLDNIYTEAEERLRKGGLFEQDYTGLHIMLEEGKTLVVDETELKKGGAISQIETAAQIIRERRNENQLYKELADTLDDNARHDYIRGTLYRTINNESMGSTRSMNPRLSMAYRGQGLEDIDKLVDETMDPDNFNSIKKGSLRQLNSDFIADRVMHVGLSEAEGTKVDSAVTSIAGILKSQDYLINPESFSERSQAILELEMDDITFRSGLKTESLEDVMDYGIFKVFDENAPGPKGSGSMRYSTLIERRARSRGIVPDNIQALKIKLNDGIRYNYNGKEFDSIVLPLFDITPYRGEFYRSQSVQSIQNVLNAVHDYSRYPAEQAQAELEKKIGKMYESFGEDVSGTSDSLMVKRLIKTPIAHSMNFEGKSSIYPSINYLMDEGRRKQWLESPDYRNKIISAVRDGRGDSSIGLKTEQLVLPRIPGIEDSSIIHKGKMRYLDVAWVSRDAIEKGMDIDFTKTGRTLLNTEGAAFDKMSELVTGKKVSDVIDIAGKIQERDAILKRISMSDNELTKAIKTKTANKAQRSARDDINRLYRDITEEYLTKIGAFGDIGRDPSFREGSIIKGIIRVDNSLNMHELRITPVASIILNNDFDADKPYLRIAATESGQLLNMGMAKGIEDVKKGGQGITAGDIKEFMIRRNEMRRYLDSGKSNDRLASLMEDESEAIVKNGGKAADNVLEGNPYAKAQFLERAVSSSERKEIIELLKQDNFNIGRYGITKEMLDNLTEDTFEDILTVGADQKFSLQSQKLIPALFEAYDSRHGNFYKNRTMLAAAVRARDTKSLTGYVSNPNFRINEEMQDLYRRTLNPAHGVPDQAKIDRLKRIKVLLHTGDQGFLPDTEQFVIDVKHVAAGKSVARTAEYQDAIKDIFVSEDRKEASGIQKGGFKTLYKSLSQNKAFKDAMTMSENEFVDAVTSLEYEGDNKNVLQARALKDLAHMMSEEQRARVRGEMSGSVRRFEDALKHQELINKFLSGELDGRASGGMTTKDFLRMTRDLKESDKLMYSVEGVGDRYTAIQELQEGNVYFRLSDEGRVSSPEMLYLDNIRTERGKYQIHFTRLNNRGELRTDKNRHFTFGGGDRWLTADEVNERLQKHFRHYKAEEMSDVKFAIDNTDMAYRDTAVRVNAQRYLKAKKLDDALTPGKFLGIDSSGNVPDMDKSVAKASIDVLDRVDKSYGKAFDGGMLNGRKAQLEIESALKYIKSRMHSGPDINVSEMLDRLNGEIIRANMGKKTSTSVEKIFKDYAERLGGESIYNEIMRNSRRYKEFKDAKPENFKIFFDKYDDNRHDLQRVSDELEEIIGDAKSVDISNTRAEIINEVERSNKTVNDRLQDALKTRVLTDSDLSDLLGWYDSDLGEARVGILAPQWAGRKFNTLTLDDIDLLLNARLTDDITGMEAAAFTGTQKRLRQYRKDYKPENVQRLLGIDEKYKNQLQYHVDKMIEEAKSKQPGGQAAQRQIGEQVAEEMLDGGKHTNGSIMRTFKGGWESFKNFVSEHPKGAAGTGLALAALGIVNGIMNRNDSPLSPNLKAKPETDGLGRGNSRLPKRNEVLYANPSDGLSYSMSAKSLRKINHLKAAQNVLGGMPGGVSANVTINDERRPVSDSWLQEKLANYI